MPERVFQPIRYLVLVQAVGAVGACLLAINFGALLCLGPHPSALVSEQTPMSWQAIEEVGRRVSGLLEEEHRSGGRPQRPFAVYVGMSTAREGIDPEVLRAAGPSAVDYVGLCGSGGSMDGLLAMARPLLKSDLHPQLALICLHPSFLVGRPERLAPVPLNPLPALVRGEWKPAAKVVVRSWNWFSTNQRDLNHAFRKLAYGARERVFEWMGEDRRVFSRREPNPRCAPARMGYPERADDEFLAFQWENWERFGWFDVRAYEKLQESQAADLLELFRGLQGLCPEVVVVMMPEHSRLRAHVPAQAKSYLEGALRKGQNGIGVPILDFQDSIPDPLFSDYSHLNTNGRATFSKMLARALKRRSECACFYCRNRALAGTEPMRNPALAGAVRHRCRRATGPHVVHIA